MVRAIDHIVIVVRDLAQATDDYRALGFTVTPGGEHVSGGTHNALVSFADGAYFELIAFKDPDREHDHKWWPKFRNGEGTVDFALRSSDLEVEAPQLREAGITVEGPVAGGRKRPDGIELAWKTLLLDAGDVPLPFVIEDVTAHHLRVPPGAATEHAVATSGVAGVTLLVPNLDQAASRYESLLGAPGEPSDSTIEGVGRAQRFPLGNHWIELAQPAPDAEDLLRHIKDRGAAPYEIVVIGRGPAELLPLGQTHQARIRYVPA